MNPLHVSRREFLGTTGRAGAVLGLGNFAFLSQLPPVRAEEARLDSQSVQFLPEIEPLVRLIEETERQRLLEQVAHRLRHGLNYRELLAALLLAGVRNVQPRPVGFKFHAVLVVNSAHLASLSSPDSDRWLPIFWALDYFKSSQARDIREGNWTMQPVDESAVPAPEKAKQAFTEAMDNWDEAAADAAVAGLARSAGSHELFEIFCQYGVRDFRDIGHKAIFVANSWRTLQCIGWQHAEPVLRSLAYALLAHEGGNPAKRDAEADRPWRRNRTLALQIKSGWQTGRSDPAAGRELLQTLRTGTSSDAAGQVVALLNSGVSPQTVWDALFEMAGELLMRRPGIVALHAVTTTNAIHYAYQAAAQDATRRRLLLQNAAFLPMFRGNPERLNDRRIDELDAEPLSAGSNLDEIFSDIPGNRPAAARKVLAYLSQNAGAKELIDTARRMIFLKGTNSHDYKFSSAVLEDFYHVSPGVRDRFLAASVFNLRGTGTEDNELVQRTRAALAG